MAAILGRASCLQLGSKFETVHWKPKPWRAVHTTSCLQSSAAFVDEVAQSDGSEIWTPPQIERLYEDEYIIGVSKPGTLLVHNNKGSTLLEKQRNAFLKNLVEAQLTAGRKVSPVHRIDRPSSGVIIFSKSGDATRAAQVSCASKGSTPDYFVCDEPVNDEKGIPKSAVSQCEKLLDLPEARCSLLKVIIKTGRWHQIRKHLNHRAHHVVGDVQHGKGGTNRFFRENYKMRSGRIFLHAARLTFPHPLHLSKEAWTSASAIDKTMNQYNSASDSELESDIGSVPADCSIWMSPTTSVCEDPKTRHQLLTIRASLPADLLEFLFTCCILSFPNCTNTCKITNLLKDQIGHQYEKKKSFMKLLTSQMSNLSVAPNQTVMKKHAKKREMASRNPTAIEPQEYVDEKKVCTYCKSINNCKYKYVNNSRSNQPRYQCLNEDCKKLFALVLHNRPTGRTYSKKRGEDPVELQGLTRTCPHCGGTKASFTYYNNDKQKKGLQPRFKCLNDNCKKHFQMRKVTNDDGRIELVHTSRSQTFTRLLTSNEQQPQEYNEFGGTLPTYGYPMSNANTAPDANKQQPQEYNEFGGGTLPTYGYPMSNANIAPDANEQELQEYNEFGGTTLPTYGYPISNANIAPYANEQPPQEYNAQFGGMLPAYGYPMSDANTAPYANEQQPQQYNEFGGTLPEYDYHMYDVNIAPDASYTSTKNDLNPEMDVQVREVGRDGLNNQESLAVETTQDYHTNSNASMSPLWGGDFRNGNIFQNGDILQNGDSERAIVQESWGETIQGYNREGNPSMPLNDMVPNGDIYQNGDSAEPEINQESHVETIQDDNREEDNPSMPWNDTFQNGDNFQNDVSEPKSAEFDAQLNYWGLLEPLDDKFWDSSTLLVDGD